MNKWLKWVVIATLLVGIIPIASLPASANLADGVADQVFGTGTSGNANGQFNTPYDMATDSNGNVFVLDRGNNRVQKFSANGTYISKFGLSGYATGEFSSPHAIAIDANNNIYVADTMNLRIQKFDANGTFIRAWGATPAMHSAMAVYDIALDGNGNLYAAVYDFINQNANYHYARILKYDISQVSSTTDPTLIGEYGTYGTAAGNIQWPKAIAIDSAGNVLIADSDRTKIIKLTSNLVYQSEFGSYDFNATDGTFVTISSLALDASGNIYVGDSYRNRIQVFDANGTFIRKWGSLGNGTNQYYYPQKIRFDATGNLFIADAINNRVVKLNYSAGNNSNNNRYVRAQSITLDKESVKVLVGRSDFFIATVLPVDVSNSEVKWTSSDEKIATVNANGVVTGVAVGQAKITATTYDSDLSASGTVYVVTGEEVANDSGTIIGPRYILGYKDGTFRPDARVSNGELALMLSRLLNLGDGSVASAIQTLTDKGLLVGDVNPERAVKKGEWNTIVRRYLGMASPYSYSFSAGQAGEIVTREEIVLVLNRLFKVRLLTKVDAPTFKDVAKTHRSFLQIESTMK